ncbi:MAG TPA: hypothetical protein VIJ70_09300, partial [Gaiellaceae bacterium]
RAFGQRATSAVLAWALACVFVAWSAVFILHRSIHLAVAVLAVLFVTALAAGVRRASGSRGARVRRASDAQTWLHGPVLLFGVALGWALWHVQSVVVGDGLFHEARVRKLVDLTSLHLRSVDEFKDGGLHPGYAFPLWHGFLALVSWFSGVDPGAVVRHEPSLLAPLACVVAFEAGVALFGTRGGGVSVLLAQLAVFCFGPGHGGSYATLALPGTAARQLLVPAAIALFFTSRPAATFAIFGALTLTHPTYTLFLLIPLAGYAIVRYADWREWWRVAVAALVPTGLVLLWLKPIIDETVSHNPKPGEVLRGLQHYGDQLVVTNDHHYRLAAEVFGRSGAVAVAALILLPVCAFAIKKKWAAFVVGGTLLVLVLVEVPWLFVHFSDAVSLSQARRVAGFAPLPFALAGAFALLARSLLALPVALAAGIVLQRLWPGDFDYGLRHGGPALATWIALFGGAAAFAYALVRRSRDSRDPRERHGLGAVAMLCFVAPVFVHGIWNWSPRTASDPDALSPRLVHRLRTVVPKGSVVIAPIQVSYRVTADAPLYVVALPVSHVANTKANDPYGRRKAIIHWNLTNDPKVAKHYGATWAIRGGRLYRLP